MARVEATPEQVTRTLGPAVDVDPLGGGCRIRMVADTLDWLAFRLIRLGADFVAEEPAELTEHLARLGARIARAASAGGSAS